MQLLWQQFLLIFVRINVIFCTKTSLISYGGSSRRAAPYEEYFLLGQSPPLHGSAHWRYVISNIRYSNDVCSVAMRHYVTTRSRYNVQQLMSFDGGDPSSVNLTAAPLPAAVCLPFTVGPLDATTVQPAVGFIAEAVAVRDFRAAAVRANDSCRSSSLSLAARSL